MDVHLTEGGKLSGQVYKTETGGGGGESKSNKIEETERENIVKEPDLDC